MSAYQPHTSELDMFDLHSVSAFLQENASLPSSPEVPVLDPVTLPSKAAKRKLDDVADEYTSINDCKLAKTMSNPTAELDLAAFGLPELDFGNLTPVVVPAPNPLKAAPAPSADEGKPLDKKMARVMANRASAKKSRERKNARLAVLEEKALLFDTEKTEMQSRITALERERDTLFNEVNWLRQLIAQSGPSAVAALCATEGSSSS